MGKKNVAQQDLPPLSGRNDAQIDLIRAIRSSPFTVAVGPAGTGKTYIAARMAAAALRDNVVSKIVLTRPAVGAGETLGFVPGDINEKMGPYLDEIVRVLKQCFPNGVYGQLLKNEMIEIVPFEYMRSRTWDDCFVILDEAQNTMPGQMKLFTTRIGESTRIVVCGDQEQSDLHPDATSGLDVLVYMIDNGMLPPAKMVEFDESHVVRSAMCAWFVNAWGKIEKPQAPKVVYEYRRDQDDSFVYEQDVYELDGCHTVH